MTTPASSPDRVRRVAALVAPAAAGTGRAIAEKLAAGCFEAIAHASPNAGYVTRAVIAADGGRTVI